MAGVLNDDTLGSLIPYLLICPVLHKALTVALLLMRHDKTFNSVKSRCKKKVRFLFGLQQLTSSS